MREQNASISFDFVGVLERIQRIFLCSMSTKITNPCIFMPTAQMLTLHTKYIAMKSANLYHFEVSHRCKSHLFTSPSHISSQHIIISSQGCWCCFLTFSKKEMRQTLMAPAIYRQQFLFIRNGTYFEQKSEKPIICTMA